VGREWNANATDIDVYAAYLCHERDQYIGGSRG